MEDPKALKKKLARYVAEKKELELRNAELTDFIENASVPLHWVGADGVILWANQAELDLLGYTREEYIGRSIRDFHADQEVITDILTRLGRNETLMDYPSKLNCKNGKIRHVLISSSVFRKDGKFMHTRCFTRDISEYKAEEEGKWRLLIELEESEARLRMTISSTHIGTWDWNLVSGELYWSGECKQIFGLAPDQPVTLELMTGLTHPDDLEKAQQAFRKAMHPGARENDELVYRIFRFNDNSIRWVRAQGKVFFNADGQPERFIGTMLDITDIKQAEERSAELVAIVDSSDDAIISKSLAGVITSWNAAAERMFGYAAEEMIGQPILKLIPPDRQQEEQLILSRLLKGERVEQFETKRLTRSGLLLDVSLTISPVKDTEGRITGLSKIARDITEKKRAEQRKNDFVAMVSHELKTPLTSISSYIQLLVAKAKKEGDQFSIDALTRTEVQTKKMRTMVEDFLTMARMEEAKLRLNKEPFALHLLIDEIARDTQFVAAKHSIRLKDCTTYTVNADRDKIGLVLTNLLSNAVKYSPKGGNITIGCEKQENQVKLYVSDEGMGISPTDQKRLFERFYRVQDDRLKHVSGFGIGLYLVAEILRHHGSQIRVESEEGAGSTFHFNLETVA